MSEFIGTKLTMNLGERSYDIILKSGALENLYQFARLDRRVAVVTDSGVPAQYAQRVADQCKDAKIITVPQGEGSKSFKILETVLRQMLEFNMGRGDLVIAVGGGVVGLSLIHIFSSTLTPFDIWDACFFTGNVGRALARPTHEPSLFFTSRTARCPGLSPWSSPWRPRRPGSSSRRSRGPARR